MKCGEFKKQNLDTGLTDHYCILCNSQIDSFFPGGYSGDFFRNKKIIGGGYRENVICPNCRSMDRERWCYYVMQKYTDIFQKTSTILHFAPERRIADILQKNEKADYYKCDLYKAGDIHKCDITDIQFRDHFFDYIIVNHVLEHVKNEAAAINELKRVLKEDGKIILSFPVCPDMKTYEDDRIVDEAGRLRAFGQEDHVRIYGKDFLERLSQYGLNIKVYTPCQELEKGEIEKYGFISDDILMVCSK